MMTLYEFGQELLKIREAVDSLSVQGQQNARLIAYCYDKCNGLIRALNEAADEPHTQPDETDTDKEEGDDDAEHSGIS